MSVQLEPSLVASGNTYNPSLIVLRQKGYKLWLEKSDTETFIRSHGRKLVAHFSQSHAGADVSQRPNLHRLDEALEDVVE